MTNIEQPLAHIFSPNERFVLEVAVRDATIVYRLKKQSDDDLLVDWSRCAVYDEAGVNRLAIEDVQSLAVMEDMVDDTWEQPWGEQRYVRNHYRELSFTTDRSTVTFRVFDTGMGVRYQLFGEGPLVIACEETEFLIGTKASAWWIPALGHNHYEHLYKKTPLSQIDTAHTPLTIERDAGGFLSIHEAALYRYGAMNIVPTEAGLVSSITPRSDGAATRTTLPFTSPWRTIEYVDRAIDLGQSKIMLNLNEPSKLTDTTWIRPMKFMGIWWAMFIGYFTWSKGEKHGATTANALRYINAAKKLGIAGLLIEGWNEDWEGDWIQTGERKDFMLPYPDFDIRTVTSYAASRGVDIVGHHETAGSGAHYEWQLPEAYDYYRHFGVRYIKTGYVNAKFNKEEFHSSQIGVEHYQKTVELAAERRIMLDIHEPVKGTGIERTWPNLMTREGVMGQEYEGGAVTPEHATVLPFTRLLAGPLDYTPGLFNLSGTERKVRTTLAKQLAFYVTMYSPMQMVADLPEHYEVHPDAFTFIKDVPVNWETTVPLAGVIGDYYGVARKDRTSDDWYIGAVTDEEERVIELPLDFLQEHHTYHAHIYRDGDDADWQGAPESYQIDRRAVSSRDTLSIRLAPGGGCAIRFQADGALEYPYPDR